MARLFLLLLLATTVMAAQYPVCKVCGEGMIVTKPHANFVIPFVNSTKTCGKLKIDGTDGYISPDECVYYPDALKDLCCGPAPVPSSTPAPTPTRPTNLRDPPKSSPTMMPTPTRGIDLVGDLKQDRKDPNEIFLNAERKSKGMSSAGKASLGIFGAFLGTLAIVGGVMLVKKGRDARPRTSIEAANIDPDGSSMVKDDQQTVMDNDGNWEDGPSEMEDAPNKELL